ncbi:MAG: amylo-alpha-1,6-glucosidase [Candidatus Latescibacteria bacterium]|jgi:predicted glycogen debranching enzyme|nr:amylo-alpha-1,6-glucosidase [Candidatus Latescibacterota bacterium]
MGISLGRSVTQNLETALQREWIETNGLGGWAASTIVGAHTRRYHGLLVAATHPPVGRMVLLSKMDEAIEFGGWRIELGCNNFNGVFHPMGHTFLQTFERDLFPIFDYAGGGVAFHKTVAALHGENTTLILYEFGEGPATFVFELQPFVAVRDYHHLSGYNDAIRRYGQFEDDVFRVQAYDGAPDLFIAVPGAEFDARPDWYYQYTYDVEAYRGLDCQEDLFSHGVFRTAAQPGARFGVIVSTTDPRGRDAFELFQGERARRERLLGPLPLHDDTARTLVLASDQFIVRRGGDLRTLIAGYPWFTDWGRDTMIALPGICLATRRFEDAKRILQAFAANVSDGMLPNRFPDAGEVPDYNTVDATLWFFVAIHKYLAYTGDEAFVREGLLPVLREIVDWHERGTRYGIRMCEDGLITAGEPGVQLTWMDAKVGDWVVTPRQGKAVEINALWYNALMILSDLSRRFGPSDEGDRITDQAEQTKASFLDTFWCEKEGYLADVVDGDVRDNALRPNQIFAISLPFPLVEGDAARRTLAAVERALYTPYGLRSLAPDHADYRGHYGGDTWSRDGSYHQGTVWGWLLGPYLTALVRVRGEAGREQARMAADTMLTHLATGGVGTLSEIFDGDPPHMPRGAFAQAWSVGELLRAHVEDVCAHGSFGSAPHTTE